MRRMNPLRAASFAAFGTAPRRVEAGWLRPPEGLVLDRVVGVATDSVGRVLVAHRGERPLLAFAADGAFLGELGAAHMRKSVVYDLRGPLPVALPERHWLHGLHVDAHDRIWITDVGRHLVMQFDSAGALLAAFGEDGVPGEDGGHFNQPTHVATVPGGGFYVTDGYGNSRVARFDEGGSFVAAWGRRGTGPGEFHTPHVIVTDGVGGVLVTDRENDRVQRFAPDGRWLGEWVGLHSPDGLCRARDGGFYATCGIDNAVVRLDAEGNVRGVWRDDESWRYPHAIAETADGALLVACTGDRWRVTGARPEEREMLPRAGAEGSAVVRITL